MGWAYGIDGNGREVGYGVEAECDHPDCHVKVWRGLSERCGALDCETDDGTPGCGNFFCDTHLVSIIYVGEAEHAVVSPCDGGFCLSCTTAIEAGRFASLPVLDSNGGRVWREWDQLVGEPAQP